MRNKVIVVVSILCLILLVPSAVATADVLSVDELGKEQCVKFENGKIIDFNVIDKKITRLKPNV